MFKFNFGKDKAFIGIKEDDKIVAILGSYIKSVPKADVGVSICLIVENHILLLGLYKKL